MRKMHVPIRVSRDSHAGLKLTLPVVSLGTAHLQYQRLHEERPFTPFHFIELNSIFSRLVLLYVQAHMSWQFSWTFFSITLPTKCTSLAA